MSAGHDAGAPSPDRLRGPLSGVAAEVKLVGLLTFLVGVGVLPARSPWPYAAAAVVAVTGATVALVDWRRLVRRLAIEAPLVVLAVTYAMFGRSPRTAVLGLSLSTPGLHAGAAILTKATLGVIAVGAVAASTTVPETLAGLRRLRVPRWFCELVAVAARQVDVLRAEYDRVSVAVAVRSGRSGRLARWRVGVRALGLALVRAVERADRLQLAADLRGARDP